MPNLPGLEHDVYFGEADEDLPDWREEAEMDEDDDASDPDKASEDVIAILGFDPFEEDDQPPAEPVTPHSETAATLADILVWAVKADRAAVDEEFADLVSAAIDDMDWSLTEVLDLAAGQLGGAFPSPSVWAARLSEAAREAFDG